MRPLTTIFLLVLAAPFGSHAGEGTGAAAGGVAWFGPAPRPAPLRVVSLAPSLSDTVIALGKADLLVGVTRYDDAPETAGLPRVGGFLDPSVEAVVALRPDLVLWMTEGASLRDVKRIASLGVPVLALEVVSVSDMLAATRLVGKALGDPPAGERLAREIEGAIDSARKRAGTGPRVRTLFIIGHEPLVVAGPGSFADEILRIVGAENVARTRLPWPVYSLEQAIADDPALVIDGALRERPARLGKLVAIPAVKHGAVHRLRDDSALRPGPRLVRALDELGQAVRGGRRR